MKHYRLFSFIFLLFISLNISAQRGKDGAKIVTTSEIVNAYTTLSADANIGNTSITVVNSALNTNFISNLAQGDLIMIYQVQGTSVEDTVNTIIGNSSKFFPSWGRITNYNNCGNYEFVQVLSVPNATTINFDCALQHNYTATGKVLVIRVPRYTTLTINSGGILTTSQWNGTSGGVLAVEVNGVTTINSGGKIDVSGLGFRGGVAVQASSIFGGLRYADSNPNEGAEKGEGIAGDQTFYTTMNFGGAKQCRGAAANAGGGGNAHNAGGGGGANAGNVLNWNNGIGVPNSSYNAAWALETPSIVGANSSSGGRGGYSSLSNNQDPLTVAPGNSLWGGDNRSNIGGLGGRPLDYSTGKIFIGGGGGAGEGDNGEAGSGGNGGGIIYLSTYGNITGAGQIIANGADGIGSIGTNVPFQLKGKDAGGGAGGGGAVILKTTGTVSLTGTIDANGGIGGNQVLVAGTFASISEAEGPGGGGGGGYISITSGTPTRTANGGMSGVTNCPYVSNFPPNGATAGGVGIANDSIKSFDIATTNATICANTTATLTATLVGTPPTSSTIEWYSAEFGGTLLGSGATFTTPILTSTTVYWVKVCPAPFLVPDTVTVNACATLTVNFASTDSTLCANDCIDFTDLTSGTPTGWTWYFPGAATTSSNVQNPAGICYNTAGNFDVILVATDGINTDSLFMPNFITVSPLPPVVANTTDTAICIGNAVTLTGSGAITYSWNNSVIDSTPFSPTSTNFYTVTGTDGNGCVNVDSTKVTVNTLPTIVANTTDTAICIGNMVTLTGSGGVTYTWNNGVTDAIAFSPTNTNTYTITGTDANGCVNIDSIKVTINPLPSISINTSDTAICIGDSVTLTASGATNYTWNNGVSNSTPFSPTSTNFYTVTGTDGNNCTNQDSIKVTVNPLPTIIANASDTTICDGSIVTLTGSGGTTYVWNNGIFNGISFIPLITKTYTVTGTDSTGCVNIDSIKVTVNPLPIIVANASSTNICAGDTITLTGSGATSYSWDNSVSNNTPFIPLNTTTYHVTGTDGNGCSASDSIIVTVNSCGIPPTASFSASDSILCLGDCISFNDLSTNVPTAWTWYFFGADSTSANTQNPTTICYNTPGSFDVALVSSNSTGKDSLYLANFITVNALPTIAANATNTSICAGDTLTLSGSGASSYSWDNGVIDNTPFLPVLTFTYHVTGTDANGCINTDSVTVTVNSCGIPPVVSFSASDSSICLGDCISFNDLSTNVPTNWTWYFFGADSISSNTQNPTTICYNTAGTFDVALVSANSGGQDSLYLPNFITVNPLPTVVATVSDTAICLGDSVTLIGSGANTYQWFDMLGIQQNTLITPTQSKAYLVVGTDTNGCTNNHRVVITVTICAPPIANLSASDTTICVNDCINFTDRSAGGTPTSWYWYFYGANTSSTLQNPTGICYDTTGTYSVVLVASNSFGADTLLVSSYITVDSCSIANIKLIIPNVFSPNGDGKNDLFKISGSDITLNNIKIYNRWGELLFETTQNNDGWDGKTNTGKDVTEGTYFYIISLKNKGKKEIYKGSLTLIR